MKTCGFNVSRCLSRVTEIVRIRSQEDLQWLNAEDVAEAEEAVRVLRRILRTRRDVEAGFPR